MSIYIVYTVKAAYYDIAGETQQCRYKRIFSISDRHSNIKMMKILLKWKTCILLFI